MNRICVESILRNFLRIKTKSKSRYLNKPPKKEWYETRRKIRHVPLKNAISIDQPTCANPECPAQGEDFIELPHVGHTVCVQCGTIQSTFVVQELCPLYWEYNKVCGSDRDDIYGGYNSSPLSTSYRPKFHWNEDDKLRRLSAPPIPQFNLRVVFEQLEEMGYRSTDEFINPKLSVQEACRLIDQKTGIQLYGRKWGEHWMTIVSLFTNYRQTPPMQTEEERQKFSEMFDQFCRGWPMCSEMLPGSRKGVNRSQLPQFRWVFRQFLITHCPGDIEKWLCWLPVLSKNKEKELDLFWKKMCFINGWYYIPTEDFVKRIKERLRIRGSRKKRKHPNIKRVKARNPKKPTGRS